MATTTLHRIDFGYFIRPASETDTGSPRVEPCLGYLLDHPDGALLVDTGMGSHPEVDAHYRPRRVDLRSALAAAGWRLDQVRLVANCHLHFDHCGGNPELGTIPVLAQRIEHQQANSVPDYTVPNLLEGNRFDLLDGAAEVLPGVHVIPTPGHTEGHQSVVVQRPDGAVIVAGQSHDTVSQYAADQLAWRAGRLEKGLDSRTELPPTSPWLDLLQSFDPRMVYFAHDHSVWIP